MNNNHGFIYKCCLVIFFLSGASALIYEVLWFRLASLVFGNSVWGAALVLSGFMAGLALGSYLVARNGSRVTRPMFFYAVMEITIGCAGLLVVVILPGLQETFALLFRSLLDQLLLLNLLRLFLVFIILLLPTMVMGATLPIMVKSLVTLDRDFGKVLGSLYGINTLGAVAGVLVCEYLLINILGIRNSASLAAAINLAAAIFALRLVPYLENMPRITRSGVENASFKLLLLAENRNLFVSAFLSGMALLALEIVWFRFLQLFQFGTSQIFATMLAIVLSGIGTGGLLASLCHRKKINTVKYINVLALAAGLLTLITYMFFDEFYFSLSLVPASTFSPLLPYNIFLMFPVSVVSGILFTSLGAAIKDNNMADTSAAGLLTLVNTIGAMSGSLLAGFVLLPALGMEKSFYALSLCYGLIAVLVSGRHVTARSDSTVLKPVLIAATVYLAALVFFPFGEMHGMYFRKLAERFGASRIIEVREGTVATKINLAYDFYGKPHFYK
ncbi:MAG: fused MFS/spermidine synthase, partial [Gammaproteobacteria bacterium]